MQKWFFAVCRLCFNSLVGFGIVCIILRIMRRAWETPYIPKDVAIAIVIMCAVMHLLKWGDKNGLY